MPRKSPANDVETLNIRDVPKDLLYRVKLAAHRGAARRQRLALGPR